MRVTTLLGSWPGLAAEEAVRVAADAWAGAGVDATVVRVPDGGPLSADAWQVQVRRITDTVAGRMHNGGLWLRPAADAWVPGDLAVALDAAAADPSVRRVVIALGDADAGGDPTDLWRADALAARAAWSRLDLVALVGSDRTLLGFKGMSYAATERDPSAATAVLAQEREQAWVAVAARADSVAQTSRLIGPAKTSELPGSGAAGGLAYCLAVAGARLVPAVQGVMEALGDAVAAPGDLVVAVDAVLDPASADRGVAAVAASIGARAGVPAISLSTDAALGRRDLMAAGLASAHEARSGAAGLADGILRIAHTWTFGPGTPIGGVQEKESRATRDR